MLGKLTENKKFAGVCVDIDDVSDAVLKQVLSGKSGQVVLPANLRFVAPAIRGFPSWWQERIRNSSSDLLKTLHEQS
jgi:all-trans-retinol dehydrogenase (NAD+)